MFQYIPEKIIAEAAEHMKDDTESSNFHLLLEEGKIYKDADLIPVYLYDATTGQIGVTSKQYIHKKFH